MVQRLVILQVNLLPSGTSPEHWSFGGLSALSQDSLAYTTFGTALLFPS